MDALNAKAFYTMLVAGLDNAKGPRVHPPGAAIGKRDSHISNATVDHAEGSMPDHDTALPGYQEMCGPFLGILRVYGGPECAATYSVDPEPNRGPAANQLNKSWST